MEIYQRIKDLRKNHLNLTQEIFSSKINISRANLGSIEVGRINVTDRVITDICNAFNINQHWLHTGEEDIYIKKDDTLLSKLAHEYNLSKTEQKILSAYLNLDESRRNQLIDFARCFVGELSKASILETAATAENSIDQKVEKYRLELEAEQKGNKEAARLKAV